MTLTCPLGVWAGSDAHVEPEQLMPPAWHYLCYRARELGVPVVANGDMLDLVIWGRKRYYGSRAAADFEKSVDGLECYYVVGNHEGLRKWVEQLFWACPNIHVVDCLDIDVSGVRWRVEHFDRFALDWGPFGWLFKGIAHIMLRVAPRLWLRFCARWRPGSMKPPAGVESEKYNRLADATDQRAYRWGQAHDRCMLGGHTHRVNQIGVIAPVLFNLGDLRDGSSAYVDPSGTASVKWFGSNHP